MLDIKRLRETPEFVRQAVQNKNERGSVDDVLELDRRRRDIIVEVEQLKNTRNVVSDDIARLKKQKLPADERIAEMRGVSDRIKTLDEELRGIEDAMRSHLLMLPNICHPSVPIGSSAADNVEQRAWIPPHTMRLNDDPEHAVLDHVELGRALDILDFDRGAKLSGSGFPLYVGKGATLERALINFMLDTHLREHGYREVFPPFVVNTESMYGTGQLPKMSEDMYRCADDDLYLIPTAEVPITNMYRDEILEASQVPSSFCGYSACFRREAGSYGKQTKGFLRVHQFNKVELVKFARPEQSYEELESLVGNVEHILQLLEIPYRVLLLCTGDTSFSSAKTYDIEVWSPAERTWLEASSCSNFEDFQARRANIRYRPDGQGTKPTLVHTLNGSGLATSRLMVSILENNQTPEGTVIVPKVLQPYTGFRMIG
ncbi:MAG: serine--tRNA ligase [Bacteroidota bacterium]|jgi:seryl-tRNA synthetase|nr:serine--tRNA ligase [Bacteroidota bacterium]